MIGVIFEYINEKVEVRIVSSNVFFRTTSSPNFVTIDGLKLDKQGVYKEFPDLKDREDWRQEAISRFKDKIKTFKTEMEQMKYIMEDLSKYGYKPLYLQRSGGRPVKLYK